MNCRRECLSLVSISNLDGVCLFDVSCNFLMFCFSVSSYFVFCALASRDELQSRKVKLDYEEVGTCQKDAINVWDKKLLNCRAKIRCDMEDIHSTLKEGIYVAWLLTMKSKDVCCCCFLWILKEICQQYAFPVAQNKKKLSLCCKRTNLLLPSRK